MGKKKKKLKKGDGIWLYEELPDQKSEIPRIIIKSWSDVTRADISFLILNGWTTHRIQSHFSVSLNAVLHKIRFSDSYNVISKIDTY